MGVRKKRAVEAMEFFVFLGLSILIALALLAVLVFFIMGMLLVSAQLGFFG